MNQEVIFGRIRTLLSRFQEEIEIANPNGEFSINIHAENVLLKILNVAYDFELQNVNYGEGKTFAAIDLRDETRKVAVQVTSSGTVDKVVHTLEECVKKGYDVCYEHLYFYFLKGMDKNVNIDYSRIQKNLGKFRPECVHFLDHARFYQELNRINDIGKCRQIKDLLEEQFADPYLAEERGMRDVNKGVGKLDFTEIPKANEADGRQDTFELFAREFFTLIGFQIIEDPNRGQDAGSDLIVSEKRVGALRTTEIKWLVSCKHKAHSQESVCCGDEEDIPGRVEQHHCNGFIGFYSADCSEPLYQIITSYKDRFEVEVFDKAKIESYIDKLDDASGLLKRFFPRSYQKLQETNYDEYKGMIKVYARTLQEYRKTDLYEFVKVWNWLYSYCIEYLSETCSEELIDNAYYLGDICDYISEYSKASELAQRIIDIIKGKDPKELSNHHIRLLIGCNYSLFIAKTGEPSKKQKKLNRAEDEMRHIKEILDNRCWDNETDKYFINSLYTSNYAALLMNEAALERERGEEKNRQSILKTALEYHIDSLNARDHILKLNSFTDETGSRENVLRYYYKSKSNIASVYFLLGSYDEAIKLHKVVLKHRIAENEKSNAYITKSYIVGCYVKKAELKQLNVDELEECTSYIHECELYYKNNNDRIRLADIEKKKEHFEKLTTGK